jgi:hypothetical protein
MKKIRLTVSSYREVVDTITVDLDKKYLTTFESYA